MAWIELIGSFAATLTTAAFFPQAIKTIRTRETGGLSLMMYLLLVAGVALWMIYGLLIGSWPLIIANAVTLAPNILILTMLLQGTWRSSASA